MIITVHIPYEMAARLAAEGSDLEAESIVVVPPKAWAAGMVRDRQALDIPARCQVVDRANYPGSGSVVQSPAVHPLTASQGTFILKWRTCEGSPNRSNQI